MLNPPTKTTAKSKKFVLGTSDAKKVHTIEIELAISISSLQLIYEANCAPNGITKFIARIRLGIKSCVELVSTAK